MNLNGIKPTNSWAEVFEGNRMISEFMGNTPITKEEFVMSIHTMNTPTGGRYELLEHTRYHYSYDWLMPVFEKIASIEKLNDNKLSIISNLGLFDVNIRRFSTPVEQHYPDSDNSLICALYRQIVIYIKQYNKNNG